MNWWRNFLEKNSRIAIYSAIAFIAVIHSVGSIGLLLPAYSNWFQQLAWLNLLLSFLLLMLFHPVWHSNTILFIAAAFTIGMVAETIGVHTTYLFGSYHYTEKFGFQIANVPVIIGVNWVMLAYACGVIMQKYLKSFPLQILCSAVLMVLLDILLEPFAIKHSFWVWENNIPPIKNYVTWFIVSLTIQWLFHKWMPNTTNRFALPYLLILTAFLLVSLFFA